MADKVTTPNTKSNYFAVKNDNTAFNTKYVHLFLFGECITYRIKI